MLAAGRAARSAASGWTDARQALLAQLWDEGHSAAEIGRRMATTKNAIVGRAHRIGLPPRPSPIFGSNDPAHVKRHEMRAARAAQLALARAPVVKPPFVAQAVIAQMPARPARFLGDETCCWPLGKRLACDAPAMPRKPYCAEHHAQAHAPRSKQEAA